MLTAHEVVACEGYYLDIETGDLLRIVLPEPDQCENGSVQANDELNGFPVTARFERINGDVTLPMTEITAMVEKQFGRALSGKLINSQTATQPDGTFITEQSENI